MPDPIITKRRVRCAATVDAPFGTMLQDFYNGQQIESVKGNATRFEFGFLNLAGEIYDLSNVQTLNLKIKTSQTVNTSLADQTLAAEDLDLTTTLETWKDGTQQHAVFVLSNAEMNLPVSATKAVLWLVVTAILADGSEFTLTGGNITLHQDNNDAADPAPENPGTALTIDQADARYPQIDHAVLHTKSQDLTDYQRNVALGNIGRLGRGQVSSGPYPGASIHTTNDIGSAIVVWFSGPSVPSISVKSSTGYARMKRWDNSLASNSGAGSTVAAFSVSSGTAIASPYNTYLPKALLIYPTDSAGNVVVGGVLTSFQATAHVDGIDFGNSAGSLANLQLNLSSSSGVVVFSDLPSLVTFQGAFPIRKLFFQNTPLLEYINLQSGGQFLTMLTGYDPAKIKYLNIGGTAIPLPDLTQFAVLEDLYGPGWGVPLGDVDLSQCPSIRNLNFGNNGGITSAALPAVHSLQSFSVGGYTTQDLIDGVLRSDSLTGFYISPNTVMVGSTDGDLDLSGHYQLPSFSASSLSWLTGRLNVSGCSDLSSFNCANSPLMGIDGAQDLVSLVNPSPSQYSVVISFCNLSAVELNAFFAALPVTVAAPTIAVTGNPGAATCDPSIATSKGYVVMT